MKIINVKARLSLWNMKHAFEKFKKSNLTLKKPMVSARCGLLKNDLAI